MDGATPTSFRSRFRDDLVPTLKQLQRTQPDAVLRWFYRGQFWESPEAEQEAFLAGRRMASDRTREWRPGGQHKDPRAKYRKTRDEKRAQFKRRQFGSRSPSPENPTDSAPAPKAWSREKPQRKWSGPKSPGGPKRWGGPKKNWSGPRRPSGPRGPRGPRGPGRGGKS